MAEPHVISALVKNRSELLGEIKHYETIIKEHKDNLSTIDKTIHIFDDSYDLRSVRSKRVMKNRYFASGEAKVMILDILRESNQPLKSDQICTKIASRKSLSLDTSEDNRLFNKSVSNVLNRIEKENLIERVGKDGLMVIWKIKEHS